MADFLRMSRTIIESLTKKPFCKMYPVIPPKLYKKTRGCVKNDASKCTLCTLCDKKCPTGAIKVDRANSKWEINHYQCILCNECVINCKPASLTMKNQYAAPATKKEIVFMRIKIKKTNFAPTPISPPSVAEKPDPKSTKKTAPKENEE